MEGILIISAILMLILLIPLISTMINISLRTFVIIIFTIIVLCGVAYGIYRLLLLLEFKKARKKQKEIINKYGKDCWYYIYELVKEKLSIYYSKIEYFDLRDFFKFNKNIDRIISSTFSHDELKLKEFNILIEKISIDNIVMKSRTTNISKLYSNTNLTISKKAIDELMNIIIESIKNVLEIKHRISKEDLNSLQTDIKTQISELDTLAFNLIRKNEEKKEEYIHDVSNKVNILSSRLMEERCKKEELTFYYLSSPITLDNFYNTIKIDKLKKYLKCNSITIYDENKLKKLLSTNYAKNILEYAESYSVYINTLIDIPIILNKNYPELTSANIKFNSEFNNYLNYLYNNDFFKGEVSSIKQNINNVSKMIKSINEDILNNSGIFPD